MAASNATSPQRFELTERVRGEWRGKGQLYEAVVVCRNGDGTYKLAYEDGDLEEVVPPERIVRIDEDEEEDWFEDFSQLRRYAGGHMIRRIVINETRKRGYCGFWRWKQLLARRKLKMVAALQHWLAAKRKGQLSRAVRDWFCGAAAGRAHQKAVDKFKQDYSKLAEHIHWMEHEFDQVRIGAALSRYQSAVTTWAHRAMSRAWNQWTHACLRLQLGGRISRIEQEAQASAAEIESLKMQLNRATRERMEALEELDDLQKHAKATIHEVQHLREQLGGNTANQLSQSNKPRSNRFQAFSAYSASLLANPGFYT